MTILQQGLKTIDRKQGSSRWPRISIVSKVGIPLSLIAILLISITALTAYEFFTFRNSITELSTKTLPQITLNSRLSSLLNQMLYQTERLAGARTQPERRLAWEEITDQFTIISRFSAEIDYASQAASPANQLDLLHLTLTELNDLITQKLDIEEQVRESIRQTLDVEQRLMIAKPLISSAVSGDDTEIVTEWFEKALFLTDASFSITTLHSLYQAKNAEKSAGLLYQRLQILTPLLPEDTAALLEQISNDLEEHIYGTKGLIPITLQHIRISGMTMGRSTFARSLVEEVGETGISQFIEMNDEAKHKVIILTDDINHKARLLACMTGGALLVTMVVFIYFRRALIGRLIKLNNEILNKVAGDNQPVHQHGNDEISDIARSVNYFTTELSNAKEKAEAANEAKSSFLAHMSHEIRTPLNAITGFCTIALKSEPNDETRGYLNKIEDSSHALLGIINDILDFSKIEAGELNFEEIEFDLYTLLDKLSGIISLRCAEKDIDFIIDIDPSAPKCLMGDPLRLNQILTNLLNNAVKFTDHGQVFLEVRPHKNSSSTTGEQTTQLEFRITDTGIGMTDGQVEHLFTPFKQADSSITRRFGGTGLGMTITKLLVDKIGGSILVTSRPSQGTLVQVVLPYPVAQQAEQLRLPAALSGIRVLLVDDNVVRSRATQTILQHLDLAVTHCHSISDAHRCLEDPKADHFGLIISEQWSAKLSHLFDQQQSDMRPALIRVVPPSSLPARSNSMTCLKFIEIDQPITAYRLHKSICQLFEPKKQHSANTGSSTRQITRNGELYGKHILLVEDNFINQQVAQKVLENEGIRVTIANNGREALELLGDTNEAGVELLLMDIQMPELDGYSTTRMIRSLEGPPATLPIVAMTAQAMKEDYEKCMQAGMDDYVTKPMDLNELFSTLHRFLGNGQNPPSVSSDILRNSL